MDKLKETYNMLSTSGRDMQAYVGQFGLAAANTTRRRSLTLGNAFRLAMAVGRLRRAESHNDLSDMKTARSSILRVCELSSDKVAELRRFEQGMNDWYAVMCSRCRMASTPLSHPMQMFTVLPGRLTCSTTTNSLKETPWWRLVYLHS